jgi:hypothetical protein
MDDLKKYFKEDGYTWLREELAKLGPGDLIHFNDQPIVLGNAGGSCENCAFFDPEVPEKNGARCQFPAPCPCAYRLKPNESRSRNFVVLNDQGINIQCDWVRVESKGK